jgi:hypothetical protein
MVVVASGAAWRPLPRQLSTTPLIPRFINYHTMVGSLAGTERWFSSPGRPYSHFGVGKQGQLWQWQDLRYRAASDLEGNPYSISFETEDDGPTRPIPPWSPAQLRVLIDTTAWLCVRYDIPAVLLGDSLPIPDGLSYHRLGIDPWRVSGGLRYSTSRGKTCPTDVRINQIRNIIQPAVALLVNPSPPLEDEVPYALIRATADVDGGRGSVYAMFPSGNVRNVTGAVELGVYTGMPVKDESNGKAAARLANAHEAVYGPAVA